MSGGLFNGNASRMFFVVALAFTLSGCAVVANRVDNSMNTVVEHEPYEVSAEARELHESIPVADLHSDSLLWRRNLLKRNDRGHVDLPRLQEGNVAFQVFTAVTKSPEGQNYEQNAGDTDRITLLTFVNGWPGRTRDSLKERAIYQAEKLYEFAEKSDGELVVIESAADLENFLTRREERPEMVAGLLGIEGAHAIEGNLANLADLYDAGIRVIGLAHFFDNEVAGSAHGIEQGGLSDLGMRVLREAERRGMVIDLAHSSPRTIDDVLRLGTRPVIVSHTGVQGTYDSPRNLTDKQLLTIAENDGLVGIGYWDGAVGEPTIDNIVAAMRYTADLIGAEHVALGSDFDGTTETPFDTSELAALTDALLDAGFTEMQIRQIMGENVIRFMREALKPQKP